MKRLFAPTTGPADWQRLLAKPDLHWKPGASAMSLAASWEAAQPGFPPEIGRALGDALGDVSLLMGVPEWEVALPGGTTTSHTDVMVFTKTSVGLAVVAVEGKVDETFGELLGQKRTHASAGQQQRLDYLHARLRLTKPAPDDLRYQLFHRTVSALDVARDFSADTAVMLVHSFSKDSSWHDDFSAFAEHLGCSLVKESLVAVRGFSGPRLFLGWVSGDLQFARVDLRRAIRQGSPD